MYYETKAFIAYKICKTNDIEASLVKLGVLISGT